MENYEITRTDDGILTRLGQLSEQTIGVDEHGEETRFGIARGVLEWKEEHLGPSTIDTNMLLAQCSNPEALAKTQQYVHLHIRSFLARMGLDGMGIEDMWFKAGKGKLYASTQLRFQQRRMLSGETTYPAYDALKYWIKRMQVELAMLFTIPPDAEPFSREEITHMCETGEIDAPEELSVEEDGQLLIPMDHSVRFRHDVAKVLTPFDWQQLLSPVGGKRYLQRFQQPIHTRNGDRDTPIDAPFDVRGFQFNARDDAVLILGNETTDERVRHGNSRWIKTGIGKQSMSTSQIRHCELEVAEPGIRLGERDIRLTGYLYPHKKISSTRTSVPVSMPEQLRNGKAPIDVVVQRDKQTIAALSHAIEHIPGLEGLLISGNNCIPLPKGNGHLWADVRYAALQGQPSCGELPEKLAQAHQQLLQHPGVRALQDVVRNSANTHHVLKHVLVSDVFPSPSEIEDLAQETGVCAFVANRLRNSTGIHREDGRPDFTHASVQTGWLEQLADIVRRGDAKMLWASEGERLRELVGISFVDVQRIEQFQQLSSVDVMFCTFQDLIAEKLEEQLGPYIERRLEQDRHFGIATGASTGGMEKIGSIVSQYPEVTLIGSSNLLPGQVPDQTPHAFMLFGGRERRHRQTKLARIGDNFLTLNGGRGSTGEVAELMVDMSTNYSVPGPIPLADLTGNQTHLWSNLIAHYRLNAQHPTPDKPFTAPWLAGLMTPVRSLDECRNVQEEFMRAPVTWWADHNVPENGIRGALRTHAYNAWYTGRQIAGYLRPAYEYFDIDPTQVEEV